MGPKDVIEATCIELENKDDQRFTSVFKMIFGFDTSSISCDTFTDSMVCSGDGCNLDNKDNEDKNDGDHYDKCDRDFWREEDTCSVCKCYVDKEGKQQDHCKELGAGEVWVSP